MIYVIPHVIPVSPIPHCLFQLFLFLLQAAAQTAQFGQNGIGLQILKRAVDHHVGGKNDDSQDQKEAQEQTDDGSILYTQGIPQSWVEDLMPPSTKASQRNGRCCLPVQTDAKPRDERAVCALHRR